MSPVPPSFDYYFCALGFPAQFNVLLLTSWSNCFYKIVMAPLYGRAVKNPPAKAGDERDVALIPGLGRSPGGGNRNPLQYSCLKNSMDRGAWRATARGVAESDTTELHAPSVCPFTLLGCSLHPSSSAETQTSLPLNPPLRTKVLPQPPKPCTVRRCPLLTASPASSSPSSSVKKPSRTLITLLVPKRSKPPPASGPLHGCFPFQECSS